MEEKTTITVQISPKVAQAFREYVIRNKKKFKGPFSEEVEKALIFYLKNKASTPAPGKELRPEEKAESAEFLDEKIIERDLGSFPPMIARIALIKLLRRKGYDINKAKRAVGMLITNGIYREEDGHLVLNKEGKK